MKFTEEHKKILREFGHPEKDMWQLEEATKNGNTVYTLRSNDHSVKTRRISTKECIELLGIRGFLSGISRAAFHWTSSREVDDALTISFDSSKLFKTERR